MASQVVGQFLEQRYVLDLISTSAIDQDRISLLIETNYATYNMILSIEYTLSRQRELETITGDQEHLSEKIEGIKELFGLILFQIGEESKSLWELGSIHDAYSEDITSQNFKILNVELLRKCVLSITKFCESFPDLIPFKDQGNPAPLPFLEVTKSFLSNTTFGTIDQLRVELETTYSGTQISLETKDKKMLD